MSAGMSPLAHQSEQSASGVRQEQAGLAHVRTKSMGYRPPALPWTWVARLHGGTIPRSSRLSVQPRGSARFDQETGSRPDVARFGACCRRDQAASGTTPFRAAQASCQPAEGILGKNLTVRGQGSRQLSWPDQRRIGRRPGSDMSVSAEGTLDRRPGLASGASGSDPLQPPVLPVQAVQSPGQCVESWVVLGVSLPRWYSWKASPPIAVMTQGRPIGGAHATTAPPASTQQMRAVEQPPESARRTWDVGSSLPQLKAV